MSGTARRSTPVGESGRYWFDHLMVVMNESNGLTVIRHATYKNINLGADLKSVYMDKTGLLMTGSRNLEGQVQDSNNALDFVLRSTTHVSGSEVTKMTNLENTSPSTQIPTLGNPN